MATVRHAVYLGQIHLLIISVIVTMDDPGLCGGFLTWLTKQRRPWLSGRYISVNWDVEELEVMKNAIAKEDKLVYKMVV